LVFKILVVISIGIYFIPNLGAHDRIGPQWLVLSIINLIIFFYLVYVRKTISFLNQLFSNRIIIFYCLFLIFSFISIIKSENLPESIITFSNYFSIFFCLLNLIELNKLLINPKSFILDLVLIIFTVEIIMSFYPMLNDISSQGYVLARSLDYIGASANVNVTSFSIVFKLPIILYYLETRKKLLSRFIISVLLTVTFFVIIILNSRGAFITSFLVILIYFFIKFILSNKNNFKLKFVKSIFIIIPIILSILLSNGFLSSKEQNSFFNRASTISMSTNDGSVNQRLRFYKHALSSISKNIFFGIGIGNWKLVSIDYDKKNIQQYIIPYHAHNDFLQIGSESGILAMISYVMVFTFILLMLYNYYLKDRKDLFLIYIFSSILVYLFDSLLNFPIARPINQLSLILVLSFIINLNQVQKLSLSKSRFFDITIISIVLFFSTVAIYSSYKNFVSLRDQYVLYSDYNGNSKILSTNNIHLVQETFPNLTATVLPINELKANYFIQEGRYEEALNLLSKKNLNPYSGFRENMMVQAFKGLKIDDSVYKYIRKAFYKLPSNASHSTQYFNELRKRKDIKEIDYAFSMINFKTPLVWKSYLNSKSEIYGPGNIEMKKNIDSLIEAFPEDEDFKELEKFIRIGKEKFTKSIEVYLAGEENFNQGNFILAIENYQDAINLDPAEYSYYENIAICYQKMGDTYNAYKYFDIVIDSLNPRTGKSEFYKGVNLIKDKNIKQGCDLLKKSMSYGFVGAKNVLYQFCN